MALPVKTIVGRTEEPPRLACDFTSQEFKQNPFPQLARLREAGPLVSTRVPLFGQALVATNYAAVSELLRDHQRFAINPRAAGNRFVGTILRWLPRNLQPLTTNMLLRDEPDHRRLRRLVEQAFQRQTIDQLRPRLESLADEALAQLQKEAERSRGGVDLIENFARPFPLAVICELLGLPPEDRPRFTHWASRFSKSSTAWGILSGLRGLSKLLSYVRQEFRRQQLRPRAGLMAALIAAEEAGDRLTEDELVAMVFLLLAAGHETTLHQIGHSVLTLLDHPAHLAQLRADEALGDTAVQELLRHVSFAQVAKPRYPTADTEFCGYPVRRGQMIFACLASANYDPAEFPRPESLDLRRTPNRHLAFGTGIHFCLGARLASVETEIALRKLLTRFPHLALSGDRSQIRYTPRFGTRSLARLLVRW